MTSTDGQLRISSRFDFTDIIFSLLLKGGINPTSKLSTNLTLAFANFDESPSTTAQTASTSAGKELDLGLTYKVSQDMTWTLDGGYFMPGAYYAMPQGAAEKSYKMMTGFKFSLL